MGLGFRVSGLGQEGRTLEDRVATFGVWATGRTLSLRPLRYQEDFLQLLALLLPVSSHVDGTLSPNSPQKP